MAGQKRGRGSPAPAQQQQRGGGSPAVALKRARLGGGDDAARPRGLRFQPVEPAAANGGTHVSLWRSR